MIFEDDMRKTACPDNEIALFFPKLTGSAKAAVAALAPSQDRVSVYARILRFCMTCAFPKKRIACPVQQTISHTLANIPSPNKAFRHCLLRQGCCSVPKASPAFDGTGMI